MYMVFYIQFYKETMQTKILMYPDYIVIPFDVKIGIIRNHIICASFFILS